MIGRANFDEGSLLHSIVLVFLAIIVLAEGIFVATVFGFDARFSAGLLAFVGTVWATLHVQSRTKQREIEARLFQEKSAAYDIIISIIVDLISQTKTSKQIPQNELVSKMLEFKKKLLVWGSDDLINHWNEYEVISAQKNEATQVFSNMEGLLRAIRKDLGHDDRNLKKFALWSLFLRNEDKLT